MIRNLVKLWSLSLVAAAICASLANAQSAQTDPSQYPARVAQEVKPYLSDCVAAYTNDGNAFDPAGVAACKADQEQFAAEYYGALEGDQDDKFDVGFMFQRGEAYGVKYNQTMACAWWIEMVDTGGRLPVNIYDNAIAQACSASAAAVAEASALEAEEQRITNLTY